MGMSGQLVRIGRLEWTVSEDWEVRVGMAHDILGITEEAEEAWALGQS